MEEREVISHLQNTGPHRRSSAYQKICLKENVQLEDAHRNHVY